MIYSIYKLTNNVNQKIYIGFTKNFKARINKHKFSTKTNSNILYRAIRKYGWDNFKFQIIYQSLYLNYTLRFMENYFIKEYNSIIPFGYNMTYGGEGSIGYIPNQETRKLMSLAKIGKPSLLKGIKQNEDHLNKLILKRQKSYKLTYPNQEIIYVTNLSKYCKENNLHQGHLSEIAAGMGKRKTSKGIKCEYNL